MVNAELRPNLQLANNPFSKRAGYRFHTMIGRHAECSNPWSALVLYRRQATTCQAASGVT